MRYVIFSKETCPFCTKAQTLLTEKNKTFKVVNFEAEQEQLLQEIKDAYDWPTVPMIFRVSATANIDFVGGYTDLCKFLSEKET